MSRHAAVPQAERRRIALPTLLAVVVLIVVTVGIRVDGGHGPSNAAQTQPAASPSPTHSSSPRPATTTAKPTTTLRATSAVSAAAAHIEASPGGDPAGEIAALTQDLPDGAVSVAGVNLTSGASFSYGASGGMVMGSIAKLDILEVLLLQHQDTQTLINDNDVSLATSMIENSDNDSADSLWSEIGSDPAVAAANPRLGIPDLVIGPDGQWGLGTTDATDQVTLLKNLVSTISPLDAASKAFALGLMDDVEADQRWGVGVVADAGTTFANKDGWLAVDDDADLWLTNSDAIVTVHGQQVLMSVLTQHNETENDGIALVEAIAESVAPALAK